MRNSLFVIPVGDGESLRDRLLVKNEIEEIEEWFVGVCGCVHIWYVRRGATDTTELKDKISKTRKGEVKSTLTCSRCWGSGTSNQKRTECLDLPIQPSV